MPSTRNLRPAAVAGRFYPAQPAALERAVQRHLADAEAPGRDLHPKALIVPHAGYIYSGPVAGTAYRALEHVRERISRVVLLGPSHHVYLSGLATPSVESFLTPLGEVPVDREALERALRLPQVTLADAPHAREHSLEVQLPFLQRALGHFALAPLAVGDASDGEVEEVLEALWGGDETLVVVSSDLSHYLGYESACVTDAGTSRCIEVLDASGIGSEQACGHVAVRGLLRIARRHGLRARTLDLRNSGDTAGPRDEVVGYGAYALQ